MEFEIDLKLRVNIKDLETNVNEIVQAAAILSERGKNNQGANSSLQLC